MEKRANIFCASKVSLIFLILLSFLAISLVYADGDSRSATQAEKAFSKSVLNTFSIAVPSGPEGWEKTGDSAGITELKYVYTSEKEPLRVEYRVAWQDTKKMREAQAQLDQELMNLAKKPGFDGKGVDELQKKMTPHDVKVKIEVYANILSVGIYDKAIPATVIAGGVTYRSQGDYRSGGWNEGSAYVFLGKNWKVEKSGTTYVNYTPNKSITTSTVVQNIYVKVQADPDRTRQIIQKIDWEALEKLIKN